MTTSARDRLADELGRLLGGGAAAAPTRQSEPILPATPTPKPRTSGGARADLAAGLRAAELRSASAREALALARREAAEADEAVRTAQTALSGTGFHYTT